MAQKRTFGVGGRLLTLSVATLAAVLTIILATQPAQSAPAFEYALGVNAAELNDAELDRTLDAAKAAGVNSVSSGAVWWYLNRDRSPRSYDWSALDRLLRGAEKRGMKVSLQLSGTPDWLHPDLKSDVPDFYDRIWYPPKGSAELKHWSEFVSDVVSRYKGRVVRYEMWNEPNIQEFWKPAPNPAEYAALLRAGYLSAKSVDPDAPVVFGGVSRNDVGYLDAYYSEAGKYPDAAENSYFFDVMGVHPYSSVGGGTQEPMSPDRNTSSAVFEGAYGTIDQNFLGIKKIKSAMDAQGDAGKNLWLGEYGFSTTDTWMKAVPDYRRALYLKRAYMLARDVPYVEGMRWYKYRPSNSGGPEWAIVDANLNETLTFQALRQITGAEPGGPSVTLSAPATGSISGNYKVSPTATNLGPASNWELYVDGKLQGSYNQAPISWDTTEVADGAHTLMVAAYTQEGSAWPSKPVPVSVNNGGGSTGGNITVSSLDTNALRYAVGEKVKATASISADARTTVDQLSITARPKGTTDSSLFIAFFDEAPYTMETTPKTVEVWKKIYKPGTYVLWVSYNNDGSWHWLQPEKEFTVGKKGKKGKDRRGR